MATQRTIVFVWDNFGPMHHDRLKAAAEYFKGTFSVSGIEIADKSNTYAWVGEQAELYKKQTLFTKETSENISRWRCFRALTHAIMKSRAKHIFLCNYERSYIFFTACILRLSGKKVFIMQNSKFDDCPRMLPRECLKLILYYPYNGVLVGSFRSKDYLSFLGFRKRPKVLGYNTLSLNRIRALSKAKPAPAGTAFEDRHFTIIARLVPKKNLLMALEAYAIYREKIVEPRLLHIYGNGPLGNEIQEKIKEKKLEKHIFLHGFVQTEGIAEALGKTLVLILPSIEEQFGNVVIEAQAMGLPVIASESCGACDELVRSGINGFTIKPDAPKSLACFMQKLCEDKVLWTNMCEKAHKFAPLGDVKRFVKGVETLITINHHE